MGQLTYNEFKDMVAKKIMEVLPPSYKDYVSEISGIPCINMTKEGLSIRDKEGQGIGRAVFLEDMYHEYCGGKDFEQVLFNAANMIVQSGREAENVPLTKDYVLSNVVLSVVNAELNREYVKTLPHIDVMDLSIIYRVVIYNDENKTASIVVSDAMARCLGISSDELQEHGYKNTREFSPLMVTMLPQLIGISNEDCWNGATAMLYEDFLQNFATDINSSFYILPSSVHDIIAIPAENDKDVVKEDMLRQVLEEGNRTSVSDEDYLSSNIYFYDKDARTLELK